MDKEIEKIATSWVCPYSRNPITPYEIHEVERLVNFAEAIIQALGYSKINAGNKEKDAANILRCL